MLDIKKIVQNPNLYKNMLISRRFKNPEIVDALIDEYNAWKTEKSNLDLLRSKRNKLSQQINEMKKQGADISSLISQTREISSQIKQNEEQVKKLFEKWNSLLFNIPNILQEQVPDGEDDTYNKEVKKWGTPKQFDFKILDHHEIGLRTKTLDFKNASKISGTRFVILRNLASRLERAIISFMLDTHRKKGYEEIMPPVIVNEKTLFGTGQLPKFYKDLYKIEGEDMFLSPTSEVQLVNIERDNILDEEDLPIKYMGITSCFRKEAGEYGKDIRGIIRQHQFNKVELIKICKPEESDKELELLVKDAENILELLELPYRKVLLCSGDTGFTSSKTYDLEVWIPSQNKYREISSCSNCLDFQARRSNIKIRRKDGLEYAHTLNGSGLAVGRTMVAIFENYQDENGVKIPEKLIPYMGVERIDFKN